MGKYYVLFNYLSNCGQECIKMSFVELEKILGFTLPNSARTYDMWWQNGGHTQAYAWMNAGYMVTHFDLRNEVVEFSKSGAAPISRIIKHYVRPEQRLNAEPMPVDPNAPTLDVCGYTFRFIQELVPECDARGNVIKYSPQADYDNKSGLRLSYHGKGEFCRFSIDAGDWPGVYLWVVDGQIIYIGETAGLRQRFNTGYGNIAPRNCYVGGQSTNCKMNKVVYGYYEKGQTISLYFYNTTQYKKVELELLGKIFTPFNDKDN